MSRKDNLRIQLFIQIGLLLAVVYAPFVINGGLGSGQDLKAIISLSEKYDNIFIAIESTTIQSKIFVLWVLLFKSNPGLSIFIQIILMCFTSLFLYRVVNNMFGKLSSIIFFLFSLFPIMSSDILESHIHHTPYYTMSTLFWSLSLYFIYIYLSKRIIVYYIYSYLALCLSLFLFPLCIPLILLSIFYPILYDLKSYDCVNKILTLRCGVKYITPVIFITSFYFIFRYFIVQTTYGFHQIGIKSILQFLYYYFVLIFEPLIMLAEVIPHLLQFQVFLAGLIIYLIIKNIIKINLTELNRIISHHKFYDVKYLILIFVSLIACSTFFFISQRSPTTYGYANRYMLPTFYLICILLGIGISKLISSSKISLIYPFIFLWISSMVVQLNNFSHISGLRTSIIIDFSSKIKNSLIGSSPVILACVPGFLDHNYNNESIFFPMDPWIGDLGSGVSLYGNIQISNMKIFPFNWGTIFREKKLLLKNKFMEYNYHNYTPYTSNLWFYQYDLSKKRSQLIRLNGKADVYSVVKMIDEQKINFHPLIFREKVRFIFKSKIHQLFQNIPSL